MKIRLLALYLTFSVFTVYSQTPTLKVFTKKAAKLDLHFVMPSGYHIKEIVPNRDLQYSFAIINSDSTMEVRYSFFPLKPLVRKYKSALKSKKIMMNPDSLHVGLMKANGMTMTNGVIPVIEELSIDTVKRFNADYAGTSTFQFLCEFGKGYKYGQLVCLHKNKVADVFITFMSNDVKKHTDLMTIPFYALTFK